jgi:hypothetical protein
MRGVDGGSVALDRRGDVLTDIAADGRRPTDVLPLAER